MKTLDRYLIREMLPPFLLALGMFTFLLAVKPMLDYAQDLLAKGIDIPTVAWLLMYLLPQALGVTLPMAFTTGVLMALGRLSGDRESVALLACGISPMRVLRPILVLALIAGAADMYTLIKLVPDSNLRFREITFHILVQQGESDVKPGRFYEGFPGKVLFVAQDDPVKGWRGVMLADTTDPARPVVTMAPYGRLEIDEAKRQVAIVLPGESVRYIPGTEAGTYDTARANDVRFSVPATSVFGDGSIGVGRGTAEMSIADLRREEARKREAGLSPHNEIMQRHQMFAFPVACLVFALVAVAVGLHTRKEGRLGGFTLGIAVIFIYYGVMTLFESLAKGQQHFPAEWARWMPNIVVGILGVIGLRWRNRAVGGDVTLRLPAWLRWPSRSGGDASARVRSPRVVVVIRLPAWRWRLPFPRVRILDRYVARKYVSVATLSCVSLLGFYYIGTLIDKSERLFKGQASGSLLLEYFYYSTPQFIAYVVPVAALLSALAAIGGLTRTGELIVMRACGISLYRAAAPVVLLALVWSGGLFLLDDRVLAKANRQAEVLEDQIRGAEPHTVNPIASSNWLVDKQGRIYHYSAFDIPHQTLYGLSIFAVDRQRYRLTSHTYAAHVTFSDDAWRTDGGWTQEFLDDERVTRKDFGPRPLELAAPESFSGMHNQEADLMTFEELRRHIAEQDETGFSMADARVQLQRRIAFPLVTVVMTLLGVPFGVTVGRRGALYGIGVAMILGCAYWLANTVFIAAGQADLLPAVLAAWAANLLFLAFAGFATLTVRT